MTETAPANPPKVSVVSITYNHEAYIREALDGFVAQKTDFPVEIIVADDASTDATPSIIREYAEREDINLSESYAYSDSISDLPMLSIVGHPVAANPDFRLKEVALQHDWPILNLR